MYTTVPFPPVTRTCPFLRDSAIRGLPRASRAARMDCWISRSRRGHRPTDALFVCLFVCLCVCLVSFGAVAFPSDDAAAASARESRAGSSAPSSEVAGPSLPRASLRAAVPSPPSHTGAPPAPPSPRLSLFAMKLGLGSEADRSLLGVSPSRRVATRARAWVARVARGRLCASRPVQREWGRPQRTRQGR